MMFSADCDREENNGSMHICRYARPFNSYDLYETNFEWSFLDDVRLKTVSQNGVSLQRREIKLFSAKSKKKRVCIKFFIENL